MAMAAKIPDDAIEYLVDFHLSIVLEHRDVALDLGSFGNAFHGSPQGRYTSIVGASGGLSLDKHLLNYH